MQQGRLSTQKVYQRSARAETRNRAKDELKRVINAVDRVRRWLLSIYKTFLELKSCREKAWVRINETSIQCYKWVPVTGSASTTSKPIARTPAPSGSIATPAERANSTENSNEASLNNALVAQFGINDESNTAFSENFDSDSNQASEQGTNTAATLASTGRAGGDAKIDFSSLVKEESAAASKTPNKR